MAKTKAANAAIGGPSMADQQKWQAEDDLRTLTRANEIRKDAPRYKRALALAQEQLATIKSVAESK
jgi:hypothetical protein